MRQECCQGLRGDQLWYYCGCDSGNRDGRTIGLQVRLVLGTHASMKGRIARLVNPI